MATNNGSDTLKLRTTPAFARGQWDDMVNLDEDQHSSGVWPKDHSDEWDTDLLDTNPQDSLTEDDFENIPRNWLVPAICSAVFFFPIGLIAVRTAIKAQQAYKVGHYSSWRIFVGRTRFFVFLSLFVGVITYSLLACVIPILNN